MYKGMMSQAGYQSTPHHQQHHHHTMGFAASQGHQMAFHAPSQEKMQPLHQQQQQFLHHQHQHYLSALSELGNPALGNLASAPVAPAGEEAEVLELTAGADSGATVVTDGVHEGEFPSEVC
jgi:hypothetical protein